MRAHEPDLDAIKTLLTVKAWVGQGYKLPDAHRMRAAIALAWWCGVGHHQSTILLPGEWLAAGAEGVVIKIETFRTWAVPVLEPARLIVNKAIEAVNNRSPLLLGDGEPGTSKNVRDYQFNRDLPRITDGRIKKVVDLRNRFRRYLIASDDDAEIIGWLTDNRRPEGQPPSFEDARRLIKRVHPMPDIQRFMYRDEK